MSICAQFSWMPKDSSVIGPSVLSSASGTPNSLQVAIVVARARLHSVVPGAPQGGGHPCNVTWGNSVNGVTP